MKKRNTGSYILFLLLFAVNPHARADVAQDLQDAKTQIESKNYRDAEKKLAAIAEKYPDNTDALYLLAHAQLKLEKWENAKQGLEKLIQVAPQFPDAYNDLAAIIAKQGNIDRAIQLLQKGIATQKAYVSLYDNLNKIYAYQASKAYMIALEGKAKESAPSIELAELPIETWTIKTQSQPPMIASVNDSVAFSSKNDTDFLSNRNLAEFKNAAFKTVQAWANAWSTKNVAEYLSFYDDNFQPPQSLARPLWEKSRRDRILSPKYIKVEIQKPEIEMAKDGSMASITFFQYYRSDSFNQSTRKLLVLKRINNEWKILNEYSES